MNIKNSHNSMFVPVFIARVGLGIKRILLLGGGRGAVLDVGGERRVSGCRFDF